MLLLDLKECLIIYFRFNAMIAKAKRRNVSEIKVEGYFACYWGKLN